MPYVLIAFPLVLLVVNCLRGAYCDVQMIRTAALKSEMGRLESQAQFQVSRLEALLEFNGAADEPWESLREQPWMRAFWSNLQTQDSQRLYIAITNPTGRIELHTNREAEGQTLSHNWYDHSVPEVGANVVHARSSPLAVGEPSYSLHVPIKIGERWIGDYYVGLSADWLQENVASLERKVLVGWAWMLALALVANVGAVYGLLHLAGHRQDLAQRLQSATRGRARELAQLGGGLAHEMRNPLHALRMNLHTLKRAVGQSTPLSREQIADTISESDAVIDRLDVLLRDLVQLTAPSQGERANLNVATEMQATLNLLTEDFRRDQIDVHADLPAELVQISAEPAVFRQVLLNLLTFAQHAAGKQGVVEVQVAAHNGHADITVANSGFTLTDEQHAKLFDPFQTPVDSGSGLGLALVQSQVSSLGGTACGQRRAAGGTALRIRLPLATTFDSGVSL
jgi:signal transduction histidine kinase